MERQDRLQEPWIGCVASLRGTKTSADGLHVHDTEFVHRAIEPVGDQEGAQGFDTQPATRGILLAEVGRLGGGSLELFERGHEADPQFRRRGERVTHYRFIEHDLGIGRHGSQSLALELLMHIHKLVEGKFMSLVHARHSGGKRGLVLRVCLVAEVMEVGGGKETALVGHRINLLADVGCRHEENDAAFGSVRKHQNGPCGK